VKEDKIDFYMLQEINKKIKGSLLKTYKISHNAFVRKIFTQRSQRGEEEVLFEGYA